MRPQTILIVGGGSRSARAFRSVAAQRLDMTLITLMRAPCPPLGTEEIFAIQYYFDPPTALLARCDVVINCAGITHGNDVALLKAVNTDGPTRLAAKAKACGVKHFVQLSSFKVYGSTQLVTRVTPEMPDTPYGQSKLAADVALRALQDDSFAVTILRLPMLYGGGAGDNLLRIGRLMTATGIVPIPRATARRSVLHIKNLAAILTTLVRAPRVGICIAADEQPLTLVGLAQAIGEATGRRPRLIKLPDMLFTPLRLALPSLYNKVFESKFAPTTECIRADEGLPVALHDGLVQMFSRSQAES